MAKKYDVVVIGAGPGGYPAAIRAAQLGKSVLAVDLGTLGGECLNWGCIPSKALISAANFYHKISKAEQMGIKVEKASVDIKKLQEWKRSVQNKLISGVSTLFKGNKVEYLEGKANFVNPTTIEVEKKDGSGKELFEGKDIIIATGAEFISLPGFEIDEIDIMTAKGILSLDQLPENLLVIGGGIIGMELGTVYAKLGSKVTVVELLPEILPGVDEGLVRILRVNLKKLGITIYNESKATKLERKKAGSLEVEIETKTGKEKIVANKILISIGKRANTQSLKLDRTGVKTDNKGFITIDKQCRTNVPHVYAIGDCTGTPFLAHRATKQGIVAAEVIAGEPSEFDFMSIPGAIFTDPEIAFSGLSEAEAKSQGFEIKTGRMPFGASGRALSHLEELGYVKIIADAKTDVILGIEIIGPDATDLISEAALALEMGATLEDVGHTIHPHPTLPEMIMQASEGALGKAIDILNKK